MAGKIVLLYRNDTLKQSFITDATRYTDDALEKMGSAAPAPPADTAELRRRRQQLRNQAGGTISTKLKEMAVKEGALALLSMSPRGVDGTLFVQGGGAYGVLIPKIFWTWRWPWKII
ncbi:MAG: hypothetical protein ABIN94_08045 [Ferruginibacter sp.]